MFFRNYSLMQKQLSVNGEVNNVLNTSKWLRVVNE